jgi:hypothetical protein
MFNFLTNNIIKILLVIVSILVLSSCYLYMSTKHLKSELNTLKLSNSLLEDNLKKQDKKFAEYIDLINKNIVIIKELTTKNKEIENNINNLNLKLKKHDLENIAKKKPKLLENIINKGVNKEKRELMELTK